MTKYVHIVQVHPVENGEPNLHKVKEESEYDNIDDAMLSMAYYNLMCKETQAVYYGRVNDATGELE